jgi:hypothetical protein
MGGGSHNQDKVGQCRQVDPGGLIHPLVVSCLFIHYPQDGWPGRGVHPWDTKTWAGQGGVRRKGLSTSFLRAGSVKLNPTQFKNPHVILSIKMGQQPIMMR